MEKRKILLVCIVLLSCLAGCRERVGQLAVSIYDGRTETKLAVREGATVREVLEDAELALGEEDTVLPSLDTEVTRADTQIRISRDGDIGNSAENKGSESCQKGGIDSSVDAESVEVKEEQKERENGKQLGEDVQSSSVEGDAEIVSKEKVYDCDGSGHGYYYIKWSDGREEYEDF